LSNICSWAQIKEGKGTNFLSSKLFFHHFRFFHRLYTYKFNFLYVQFHLSLIFAPSYLKPKNHFQVDTKVTLSFDEEVIQQAKKFAAGQNISLSRLVEILLRRATTEPHNSLEDIPIADWVLEISQGSVDYRNRKRTRKETKDEFFSSKK